MIVGRTSRVLVAWIVKFRDWLSELGHDTYAEPFEPMREHEPAART